METIDIFKALANEHRLQILKWLKQPKAYFYNRTHPEIDEEQVGVCVGEIQRVLGLTQSTTSQYLAILHKANLVTATRVGKWTYYRRNPETLSRICRWLEEEL